MNLQFLKAKLQRGTSLFLQRFSSNLRSFEALSPPSLSLRLPPVVTSTFDTGKKKELIEESVVTEDDYEELLGLYDKLPTNTSKTSTNSSASQAEAETITIRNIRTYQEFKNLLSQKQKINESSYYKRGMEQQEEKGGGGFKSFHGSEYFAAKSAGGDFSRFKSSMLTWEMEINAEMVEELRPERLNKTFLMFTDAARVSAIGVAFPDLSKAWKKKFPNEKDPFAISSWTRAPHITALSEALQDIDGAEGDALQRALEHLDSYVMRGILTGCPINGFKINEDRLPMVHKDYSDRRRNEKDLKDEIVIPITFALDNIRVLYSCSDYYNHLIQTNYRVPKKGQAEAPVPTRYTRARSGNLRSMLEVFRKVIFSPTSPLARNVRYEVSFVKVTGHLRECNAYLAYWNSVADRLAAEAVARFNEGKE